ncbi:MAG: hypothetical protein IJJ38_02755 [Lachnospiraceae bacterium]|nr:hypothetical protein [Lachnospiraceae bacterium]
MIRTVGGIRSEMESFPQGAASALGELTAKIKNISNRLGLLEESEARWSLFPRGNLRHGELTAKIKNISNRLGLLEEFEARWSLFPRGAAFASDRRTPSFIILTKFLSPKSLKAPQEFPKQKLIRFVD